MTETLAELLFVGRLRLGWSMREVERRSGVSHATVSLIETGKIKDPSIAVLARLAAACKIPVTQLAEAAGHPRITQRLVLDGGYPDGIWTCAGCRAPLTEGLISHAPGCPEMSGNG